MKELKSKAAGKKVLIVEDDALLVKIFRESFLANQFQVLSVVDGLKVTKAVKKFNPDMILLDLIIPGINGFKVLKLLKDDAKTKHIPVAVVSNLGDIRDIKYTKELGAATYFIKSDTEVERIVKYVKKTLKV